MRVSPFGHLRIKAYVRLPGAFRSLSRPSTFLFYGSSLFTLELFYGLSRMSAGLSRLL